MAMTEQRCPTFNCGKPRFHLPPHGRPERPIGSDSTLSKRDAEWRGAAKLECGHVRSLVALGGDWKCGCDACRTVARMEGKA
jgi:hypothetical protein